MSTTPTRAWHGALAALIAVALVWQTVLVLRDDASLVNLFSYFTIQSNILMMVGAAGVALDPRRGGAVFEPVRLAGLVGITITGIVYATILAGDVPLTGAAKVLDTIFHYVVPAASIIGFVLIQPRSPFTRRAWWFVAWAFAWLAYTLLRAEIGNPVYVVAPGQTSTVPYDFLDASANGGGFVFAACVIVTIAALGIAALYVRLGGVRRSES